MSMTEEQLVPVEEVAARVGLYWLDAVNAEVLQDWAGRPAVRASDAERARVAFERDLAEHEAAERDYKAYLRDREAKQLQEGEEAATKAFEKAWKTERKQRQEIADSEQAYIDSGTPPPSPAVHMAAITARHEALAKFDKDHPVIPFSEWRERQSRPLKRRT